MTNKQKELIEKLEEMIDWFNKNCKPINTEYVDYKKYKQLESEITSLKAEQSHKICMANGSCNEQYENCEECPYWEAEQSQEHSDLKELEKRFDDSLAKETTESLNELLSQKVEEKLSPKIICNSWYYLDGVKTCNLPQCMMKGFDCGMYVEYINPPEVSINTSFFGNTCAKIPVEQTEPLSHAIKGIDVSLIESKIR
jgi:hypothetical protein